MNQMNELVELYKNQRYVDLANQVENHALAMYNLMQQLNKEFPPKDGRSWVVMGDNRPYQKHYYDE